MLKALQEKHSDRVYFVMHTWVQPWYCIQCIASLIPSFNHQTRHPQAYVITVAAVTAYSVGGLDAFWRMSDYLFEHSLQFTDEKALLFSLKLSRL